MKSKIIGLVLLGAIFTGVGSYGTYAYFVDSDIAKDTIEYKFGTLKLDVKSNGGFKLKGDKTEGYVDETKEGLYGTNIKFGDTFFKEITIKNIGDLDGNLSIKRNSSDKELLKIFDISFRLKNGTDFMSEKIKLKSGEEQTIILELKVKNLKDGLNGQRIKLKDKKLLNIKLEQLM